MIKQAITGFIIWIPILVFGQNDLIYEQNLVTTERLTMEYMDFGGEGTAVINIQGAHNFFDKTSENPYVIESNQNWIAFCKSFTNKYQVFAPLNRGFGKTEKATENFTVQNQVQDLISWMDYLKIDKAFFFGKGSSAQNMLFLAENYPERVLGIVFVQPIIVFADVIDSITLEYQYYNNLENYSESEFKNFSFSEKSEVFRPKTYNDSTIKIDIPLLYFYHDIYDNRTLWMGRIERFINAQEKNPDYDWDTYDASPEVKEYYKMLASDKKKMQHIKNHLEQNNPAPKMNDALKSAFREKLILFNESNANVDSWWDMINYFYIPVMNGFFYVNDTK